MRILSIELNIFPKFVDEAMSPIAQSIGQSVANLWNLAFASHIDLWLKKQEYRHQLNYQDYVNRTSKKLNDIPINKLIEPPLNIIGPAIEASKYYIDSEYLREFFANLIAASMNNDKIKDVHPSYVEIIKQISPDEAKLLKYIAGENHALYNVHSKQPDGSYHIVMRNFSVIAFHAGCESPLDIATYLDNLSRLGLIQLDSSKHINNTDLYTEIEEHAFFQGAIKYISPLGTIEKHKGVIESTIYGKHFFNSCIE